MNPYFPSQYAYPNQPAYLQGSSSYPMQVQPNISAMYNTVQPYNSKQFLLSTFGNRSDYIQVFLSLSHDDKLMMYMLTEQKKIYGEIKNKESYQRLLKDIAQKVQNYHNFYDNKKTQTKEEQKSKELEHKIDDIVQKTFQKLNLSDVGQQNHKKKQGEEVLGTEENEEQWVESQVEPELPPFILGRTSEKRLSQKELPAPIMTVFSFDSQMEKAMTQQIGLKPEFEKKSIWDLDLGEDQIKGEEPNFKEIFKSEARRQQQNTQQQCSLASSSKEETPSAELYSKNQNHPFYSNENPLLMNSQNDETLQVNYFESLIKSDYATFSQISLNSGPYINDLNKEQQQQIENKSGQDHYGQSFADEHIIPEIDSQKHVEEDRVELKISESIEEKKLQQNNVDLFQVIESTVPGPEVVSSSSNNEFQFDFLGSYSQPSENKEESILNSNNIPQETIIEELKFEQNSSALEEVFSARKYQQPSFNQQQHHQPIRVFSPRNELFSSSNGHNYKLLEKLKLQLKPKEKEFIEKMLKNKSFQCNTQFYDIIMKYLQEISLRNTEEYRHFREQHEVALEIHEETQKYTKAVDEDEEDKVFASIKRTKMLYQKIYAGSNRTEQYANLFLQADHHQKGFLFKFGKVLVDSCINQDILEKVIIQDELLKIENSFYTLYLLEKCNSLNNLRGHTQKIMTYVTQEYQKYRHLDQEKLQSIEQLLQKPDEYLQYIKGLMKMFDICEKMIILLKTTCLKSQSNMVRTLKICKDIKSKYHQYRQQSTDVFLPQAYKNLLKGGIQKNSSLYDLHVAFSNLYKTQPICKLCLHSIDKGGERDDFFYHFSCFNLLQQVQRSSGGDAQ